MIYTVTFNPSLDYIVSVYDFTVGKINRSAKEVIFPGGKGINVSIVLHNLGMDSIPLGFVAGFTGNEIKRMLSGLGITGKFITVREGLSRINVKLRNIAQEKNQEVVVKEETEINGNGIRISQAELDVFFEQLDELKKGDVLILAGSIPVMLPDTLYCDIMKKMESKEILVVVDAAKDLLVNVLEYHPFLIKPNSTELGELFGIEMKEKPTVIRYAKKLLDRGARNVLVSMAGDGAVFVSEDGTVYQTEAPAGKVVNSVGAGDSMVAGFVYGYLKSMDYEKAFYYGVCAGSASTFSEKLAEKEDVLCLLKKIVVNRGVYSDD